jgi:uncharacterized protein (TIGR02270 family)
VNDMAISPRTFLVELYEEYLEEASFLYVQRRTLFVNPEVAWHKISNFEERLEAHLDGLMVGDRLALEVCIRHAGEGDSGELFAALCVLCRHDRRDLALDLVERLDPDDSEKAMAAADALKYEAPDAWIPDLLTILASGDPKLAPILARAFGYRRVNCGPHLMAAMKHCAVVALPQIVWALGRIGHQPAVGILLDYERSEEPPVRAAAALSLARMGEPKALDYCLDQARSADWAILPLGLAGGRDALPLLADLARQGSAASLTALGLLGDPACAPLLISRLEQPKAAPSAAAALQCLAGADLYETVFVPEEVDDDELFESEREAMKQGRTLDRGDGRPFGSTVTRISLDARRWSEWWLDNSHRFTPGMRYRHGAPLSPARLVDLLAAPETPHETRRFCAEELVTRYQYDSGFETDMPVALQHSVLSDAAAWSAANSSRFRAGAWYLGGYRCD